MNEQYEIIRFDSDIPLKFRCIYLENMPSHWHREIELILILSGSVEITHEGKTSSLDEDDLLVINRNTVHMLNSQKGCTLVSLQINTSDFSGINGKTEYFSCDSSKDNNKGRYYTLKRMIAELVKNNSNENADNHYYNLSMLYAIYGELYKSFRVESAGRPSTQKYLSRLTSIIKYIDEHYKDGITLQDLADEQHLTVPYLSSFIEKYMGISFLNYYNEVRLDHATSDLLSTDRTIEDIAYTNGFPDPRSFTNLFKRRFGTLPSIYRKERKVPPRSGNNELYNESDQKEHGFSRESNLALLAKYLSAPAPQNSPESQHRSYDKVVVRENISTANVKKNLEHTFKTFTSVGRAKEILFADVQNMLTELQRDVGYEFIKFHGLLSDDMLVYEEDENGDPRYSFVYVDKVLDFLISIGLKPLLELSFMPSALADENSRSVYSSPFYIGMPKDMKKWTGLIEALTNHLIDRYGMRTVRTWLFCVWNEPDTSTSLFGFENDEDFYRLYLETYSTVKNINKAFRFGSPSLIVTYNTNRIWLTRFINWCKENSCVPDFMNVHFYDNDFSDDSLHQHRPAHPAHSRLNMDPNSFKKCITDIKKLFSELEINELPVYLTEWNLTVSHRNLLNDTCFKSCYLAKNLLENYDDLDSFGYWVLTDMIEETQPSKEEFHGGLGLFTYDGIKKPHYYAFEFINRMGNRLIDSGTGYFITKSHGRIQIILYNYEHFNHLFAAGETYDMTFTERYTPFSKLGHMRVSLGLTDINARKCHIAEHVVNQKHGSAFDEWVRIGAPKLDKTLLDYLHRVSIPKMETYEKKIEDGRITIEAFLDPLEVRLIEIDY